MSSSSDSPRKVLHDAVLFGGVARSGFLLRNTGIVRRLFETSRVYRALPGTIVDPGARTPRS